MGICALWRPSVLATPWYAFIYPLILSSGTASMRFIARCQAHVYTQQFQYFCRRALAFVLGMDTS